METANAFATTVNALRGKVSMLFVTHALPKTLQVDEIFVIGGGQHVRVKIAAYPFQKYGLLEGSIQTLAPDSQASNNNNPGQSAPQGYKALVKLDTQYLESLNGDASQRKGLEAGMQVAAEIHQGRRTIMEYLLSPVQRVSAEAGRER